ncbi:DUF2786 domain-containing protein [Nakamurella sp. YIM 132087]|uniref:DUF2786 domain-containing protein n=1 Tax=Nakamurella alba TaxID=2665158 RepID=A0A7K1FKQ5_9ACTN|nr:DUF2786 domain-containing protein [Nakamurella alba]MTD13823.1 DUF2786 domain-containing protein [Nakamurella alba]
MTDKNLSRIAALLRKAESTENEHEADAYLQAAQRLATLNSVDLAVARAHTTEKERRSVPEQRTIEIGPSGKRGLRTYVQLYLAIARANQVTCDIARNSTRVYAYGFDSDLDAVDALYSSLVVQMVRSCDAYLRSPERLAKDTVADVEDFWDGQRWRRRQVERPVHATTARINFQAAFAARIGKRLAQAREKAQAEVVADTARTGVELVLRAKEVELADHYKAHSTARGSWGGYRADAGHSEFSRRAGDRAGKVARLGANAEIGGARAGIEAR